MRELIIRHIQWRESQNIDASDTIMPPFNYKMTLLRETFSVYI